MKQGQVTIFIIVGVILIIVLIILFKTLYDTRFTNIKADKGGALENEVKRSVEECIKVTTIEGISVIGDTGGYYQYSLNKSSEPLLGTPYYLDRGIISMPTTATIEQQLAQYVDDKLQHCTQDIIQEHAQLSEKRPPHSTITLAEHSVDVKVRYPLELSRAESVSKLDTFSVSVDSVRIGEIYSAIRDFLEEQRQYPSLICTSCMLTIGQQHNLSFVVEIDNATTVVSVLDDQTRVDGYPYIFVFPIRLAEPHRTEVP